jgi:hypothetical protein
VVPDNMVVLYEKKIKARGSFNVPLQPVGPFWVLEYVSPSNKRKDYDDSFHKYERELKVPYYLLFYPDDQELTLYRHNGKKYVSVKPNERDRRELPQLDLEIGLLDEWVRFWYQDELLPLPADLLHALEDAQKVAHREKLRADKEEVRANKEKQRAEQEKQRAEQEKQARLATERELEALRAQLKQMRPRNGGK